MSTRRWEDVRAELFAGREEQVRAAEDQLRDEIRAFRLAEIRKARHLTQQQVADEMGVTTARVSQIEHGQVDRAAIRGLAGYVEALGGHLELVANFGDERIVIGLWREPGQQVTRLRVVHRASSRSLMHRAAVSHQVLAGRWRSWPAPPRRRTGTAAPCRDGRAHRIRAARRGSFQSRRTGSSVRPP
jgi:transcriptional regulator with XRE-family HTH domain